MGQNKKVLRYFLLLLIYPLVVILLLSGCRSKSDNRLEDSKGREEKNTSVMVEEARKIATDIWVKSIEDRGEGSPTFPNIGEPRFDVIKTDSVISPYRCIITIEELFPFDLGSYITTVNLGFNNNKEWKLNSVKTVGKYANFDFTRNELLGYQNLSTQCHQIPIHVLPAVPSIGKRK